ncbi:MAG: ATP-binding protein [Spirochaetes bacterium]|nr:ATP-binding protein [Spirochaetota bacterium]
MDDMNTNQNQYEDVVFGSIELRGSRETLEDGRKFVEKHLQGAGIPQDIITMVVTAVDEASANIIEHYYKDDSEKKYIITLDIKRNKIIVLLESWGEEINIKTGKKIDLAQHFSDGKSRGLGVYMMHMLMDEVSYHYIRRMNVVKLVKYLDQE